MNIGGDDRTQVRLVLAAALAIADVAAKGLPAERIAGELRTVDAIQTDRVDRARAALAYADTLMELAEAAMLSPP